MSYEEEIGTDSTLLIQQKKCQMNNNVESVDLEELYEHFKFETQRAKRLWIDKYLMGLIQNATRNKIQIATEGNIL
jgi:23S rRNA pseudouridine1911/1915/1917 synthase